MGEFCEKRHVAVWLGSAKIEEWFNSNYREFQTENQHDSFSCERASNWFPIMSWISRLLSGFRCCCPFAGCVRVRFLFCERKQSESWSTNLMCQVLRRSQRKAMSQVCNSYQESTRSRWKYKHISMSLESAPTYSPSEARRIDKAFNLGHSTFSLSLNFFSMLSDIILESCLLKRKRENEMRKTSNSWHFLGDWECF